MEPSKIIFGSTEANPHRLEQAKLQRGTIDSRTHSVAHKQVVALNSEMLDKIMEHFLSGEEICSEDRKSIFLYNIGEAPNNASVYEEENICKLAKAFFIATTKQSADDEDILPQVHNTKTLLLFF